MIFSIPVLEAIDELDGNTLICYQDGVDVLSFVVPTHVYLEHVRFNEPKSPPTETPAERRVRQLREVAARHGLGNLVLPEPRFSEPETHYSDPAPDPSVEAVARLGLRAAKDDPLRAIVRVNDEAGPDGSDLTNVEVQGLVAVCYGKGDPAYKQSAFNKLMGLPFVKLVRARPFLTKELAWQIAQRRCAQLGSGQAGLGGSFMPADWAMFVEGKDEAAAMLAAAGQTVSETPPPRENEAVINAQMPEFAQRHVSLSDVESRYAGMKFSGTEPLK